MDHRLILSVLVVWFALVEGEPQGIAMPGAGYPGVPNLSPLPYMTAFSGEAPGQVALVPSDDQQTAGSTATAYYVALPPPQQYATHEAAQEFHQPGPQEYAQYIEDTATSGSSFHEQVVQPIQYFEHTPAASYHYTTYIDATDDPRGKRETFDDHPDAYLRPPSENADSPYWQDGNNWDLGYDASDILSPPMPLTLGIPYDTIRYSSEEAQVPDVSTSSSNRYESRPVKKKYPRSRPESTSSTSSSSSSSSHEERPRGSSRPYKKKPYKPKQHYDDYEDVPVRSVKRPTRRPVEHYDYEDLPVRSKGKRSPTRHFGGDHFDYEEPAQVVHSSHGRYRNNGAISSSYVKTDKHGHYKWGVRHNH